MESSKAMSPGDISVGEFLAVLAPKDESMQSTITGVPLRVLSIDLPFLCVEMGNDTGQRLIVDTRITEVMAVRDDFALAFYARKPKPKVLDWYNFVLIGFVVGVAVATLLGVLMTRR